MTATQRSKKAFVTFRAKSGRFLAAGLELANLDELAATVRPGVGRRRDASAPSRLQRAEGCRRDAGAPSRVRTIM